MAILDHGDLVLSVEANGEPALAPILDARPLQVIAIDGPIIPDGRDPAQIRGVERLFASGPFQSRCKPGFSHVAGTGLRLRVAAGEAADRLTPAAPLGGSGPSFPRVRPARIVEAFPNAFLGVCLDDASYAAMPEPMPRGKKFDWLYRQWLKHGLLSHLDLGDAANVLESRFATTTHRDERAALVCALTALLVARGSFTAVGDDAGGWLFLPPATLWTPWARQAVAEGGRRLNAAGAALRIEGVWPG